jgi:hypothetical protein
MGLDGVPGTAGIPGRAGAQVSFFSHSYDLIYKLWKY